MDDSASAATAPTVCRSITLLVPAARADLSSGPTYDQVMVEHLRRAGHTVIVLELTGRLPWPDATALAAAQSAWSDCLPDTTVVIDGLVLAAFAPLVEELDQRGAAALIHDAMPPPASADEHAPEQLRATERQILPRLRRVVVSDEMAATRLINEFGVAADRVRVVTPGTLDAPRGDGPGKHPCAILSVGTLLPWNDHDILLRSLARLRDLDWTLTIVGAAPRVEHARSLHALGEELGIAACVRFAGALRDSALEAEWAAAGMFALATSCEGHSFAVAEALRRGLPVAVTSGGAAATLVQPSAGVVVAPGDVVGLSNAMRRLIFDTPLRREMAAAAWTIGQGLPGWSAQARLLAAAIA